MLATNTASVNVPVLAATPGAGGNVQAGAISVITSPISGVDTVTNAAAFTNGVNAEADSSFRSRFVAYLASLSKATKAAVGYAITSLQQNVYYTLTENQNYNGTTNVGYFYVVVDDGTGYPSNTLLTNASNAINAIRPLGSTFGVFAPSVETANVTMTITSASGLNHATVVGNVGLALQAFINGLTLGTSLPYTQLAAIAYGVSGVTNVSGVLLNAGTSDLAATQQQKINAGTMVIS